MSWMPLVLPLLGLGLWASPNGIGSPMGGPGRRGPSTPPPAPVTALVVGPAGKLALSGDARGQLQRWRVGPRLQATRVGALPGAVQSLAWSGARAAAVDDRGSVALIGSGVVLLGTHRGGARAVAVASDGLLATGGNDGTIQVWWPRPAKKAAGRAKAHEGPVAGLAFASPTELWSVGWDGALKRWKLPKRSTRARSRPRRLRLRLRSKYGAGKRELTGLACADSREHLLTGSFAGELVVWTRARKRYEPRVLPQREHAEWIRQVAFARDGSLAVAVASAESALLLVDPRARTLRALARKKAPSVAAFLPGARALLVGHFDGTVERVPVRKEAK